MFMSKMKTDSQPTAILRHMMEGRTISPLEALGVYKTYRLAAVIHRLREEGFNIETRIKRDPKGRRFAEYFIPSRIPMTA
jgi:hypothetical protein